MNSSEIDERILNRIYYHARLVELNNLKQGGHNDKDMVKQIQNIIDQELKNGENREDEV